MAKNITIAGASYTGVPAVNLQITGGGTAKFVDTSGDTVTPETLLSGYTAHGADGEPITGTMQQSSGITPSGTINITTNGTHDVTNYAEANVNVPSSGGGGLPDVILPGDTPVLFTKATATAVFGETLNNTGISLTITKSGTYRFVTFATNTYSKNQNWNKYYSRVCFYKNGVLSGNITDIGGRTTTGISMDIQCSAGDVIEIYGSSADSTYITIVAGLTACIDWDIGL